MAIENAPERPQTIPDDTSERASEVQHEEQRQVELREIVEMARRGESEQLKESIRSYLLAKTGNDIEMFRQRMELLQQVLANAERLPESQRALIQAITSEVETDFLRQRSDKSYLAIPDNLLYRGFGTKFTTVEKRWIAAGAATLAYVGLRWIRSWFAAEQAAPKTSGGLFNNLWTFTKRAAIGSLLFMGGKPVAKWLLEKYGIHFDVMGFITKNIPGFAQFSQFFSKPVEDMKELAKKATGPGLEQAKDSTQKQIEIMQAEIAKLHALAEKFGDYVPPEVHESLATLRENLGALQRGETVLNAELQNRNTASTDQAPSERHTGGIHIPDVDSNGLGAAAGVGRGFERSHIASGLFFMNRRKAEELQLTEKTHEEILTGLLRSLGEASVGEILRADSDNEIRSFLREKGVEVNDDKVRVVQFLASVCREERGRVESLFDGNETGFAFEEMQLNEFLVNASQVTQLFGRVRESLHNKSILDVDPRGLAEAMFSSTQESFLELYSHPSLTGRLIAVTQVEGLHDKETMARFVAYCLSSDVFVSDIPADTTPEQREFHDGIRRIYTLLQSPETKRYLLQYTHGRAEFADAFSAKMQNLKASDALQLFAYLQMAERQNEVLPDTLTNSQPLGAFLLQMKVFNLVAKQDESLGDRMRYFLLLEGIDNASLQLPPGAKAFLIKLASFAGENVLDLLWKKIGDAQEELGAFSDELQEKYPPEVWLAFIGKHPKASALTAYAAWHTFDATVRQGLRHMRWVRWMANDANISHIASYYRVEPTVAREIQQGAFQRLTTMRTRSPFLRPLLNRFTSRDVLRQARLKQVRSIAEMDLDKIETRWGVSREVAKQLKDWSKNFAKNFSEYRTLLDYPRRLWARMPFVGEYGTAERVASRMNLLRRGVLPAAQPADVAVSGARTAERAVDALNEAITPAARAESTALEEARLSSAAQDAIQEVGVSRRLANAIEQSPECAQAVARQLNAVDDACPVLRIFNGVADEFDDAVIMAELVRDEQRAATVLRTVDAPATAAKVSKLVKALTVIGVAADAFAIWVAVQEMRSTSELIAQEGISDSLRQEYRDRYMYHWAEIGVASTGIAVVGLGAAGMVSGTVAMPILVATLPVSVALGAAYQGQKWQEDKARAAKDWSLETDEPDLIIDMQHYTFGERVGHAWESNYSGWRWLEQLTPTSQMYALTQYFKRQGEIKRDGAEVNKRMLQGIVLRTTTVQIPETVVDDDGTSRPLDPHEAELYRQTAKVYFESKVDYLVQNGGGDAIYGLDSDVNVASLLQQAEDYAKQKQLVYFLQQSHENLPPGLSDSGTMQERAAQFNVYREHATALSLLQQALYTLSFADEQTRPLAREQLQQNVAAILAEGAKPALIDFEVRARQENYKWFFDGDASYIVRQYLTEQYEQTLFQSSDQIAQSLVEFAERSVRGSVDMTGKQSIEEELHTAQVAINEVFLKRNPQQIWDSLPESAREEVRRGMTELQNVHHELLMMNGGRDPHLSIERVRGELPFMPMPAIYLRSSPDTGGQTVYYMHDPIQQQWKWSTDMQHWTAMNERTGRYNGFGGTRLTDENFAFNTRMYQREQGR